MSTTQNLTSILQHMFDCFGSGDMETIRHDIFAPDIVWVLPGRHPLAGTMHGPDEVLSFFQQLAQAGMRDDPLGLSQFPGDIVVAFVHEYSSHPVNGASVDMHNALRCQIVNGKIQNAVVYVGNQYIADDFFNAAYSLKSIPDRLAL